jgi:hypothetical protein
LNTRGIVTLLVAAFIASGTAIAHLSCIFLGPTCYKAQMAPPQIVQSAIDGTLVAPIGTVVVSLLFLTCALFAVSGAGYIKRLPFLNSALITISILCIVRGISTIPSSYLFPEMVSSFSIMAGVVWFFVGVLYLYGYRSVRRSCS